MDRREPNTVTASPDPDGVAPGAKRDDLECGGDRSAQFDFSLSDRRMADLMRLDQRQWQRVVENVPGGVGNIEGIYPLLPIQEGILFHHLLNEDDDPYLLSTIFEVRDARQAGEFADAIQKVVDRHDALRAAIVCDQLSQPVQVVHRNAKVLVEDVASDSSSGSLEQLIARMRARKRMQLSAAPLIRLFIVRGSFGTKSYVSMQIHHIVCDHRTKAALTAEAIAHLKGRVHELPAPARYRDYLAYVLERADSTDAGAYFADKLSDVDEPSAPYGIVDVREGDGKVQDATMELSAALALRLRTQARRMRTSAAMLFHAAWALVVARTSGRDDVVFGTVLATLPTGIAAQNIFGIAVNTLPLRLKLSDVSVAEFVAQVRQELIGLSRYSMAPLTLALRSSGLRGDVPLFTSILNCLRSASAKGMGAEDDLGIRPITGQRARSNFPLSVAVHDSDNRVVLEVVSQTRIDPQQVLECMNTAITSLVEALERDPEARVTELQILSPHELSRITVRFNATASHYPTTDMVHQLIERQAERIPNATAVIFGDRKISYRDLNQRANEVAQYLRNHGVRPDVRVGAYFHRSVDLVIALLGILKAGGAYVPVDTSYPTERQRHILEDAGVRLVLTHNSLKANLPHVSVDVVAIDSDLKIEKKAATNVCAREVGLKPSNLVYVVYTSGSTGTPKGVMVEHRNLTNLIYWHCNEFDLDDVCRTSSVASIGFDAAGWEIWPSLTVGATVVLPTPEVSADPESLITWWENEQLDTSFLPTPLAELSFVRARHKSPLRTLLVGGDRLRSRPASASYRLINNYGPTETTVVATSGEIRHDDLVLHIGRPIANTQVYILNAQREVVPVGVAGELYIGGAGVARGYLNRPELTAERFIVDRFSNRENARLYRTGDIGRWRDDGTIEYLGRNDKQVKIRGHRIELREIEAQLSRHPGIQEALVVARDDPSGQTRLVAYYVTKGEDHLPTLDLQLHLRAMLPVYMIPASFVRLERFPLTPNGKLDQRALPEPGIESEPIKSDQLPRGEIEQAIALLWEELLQTKGVLRDDAFFDLGGHSLLAVRVVEKMNALFGTTLRVADIYKTPVLHEMAARIAGQTTVEGFVPLEIEACLDEDIVARSDLPSEQPKNVLLTGATGFVGRFILSELLGSTKATIYCLVRGGSNEEAARRLRSVVAKWNLESEDFDERVIAIPGDIRAPRLGLEDSIYDLLTQTIDSVYHCATSMNHLETYEMAKAANVESVKVLFRFATQRRTKLVNYLSTLGIFSASEKDRRVDEASSISLERHPESRGYVASKWIAENVCLAARKRGIPCNIFRLGLIWADTQGGRYDELQNVYRIFKSCLMSGVAIEHYSYPMAPTPVDFAARAIVSLAGQHWQGGGTFHVSAPGNGDEDVFERCNKVLGLSLQLKPYYQWICEIKRLHQAGLSLPVLPLVEFAFSLDEESFNQRMRSRRSREMYVDCTKTLQELKTAGIDVPTMTDQLLRRCVETILAEDEELKRITMQRVSLVSSKSVIPVDL